MTQSRFVWIAGLLLSFCAAFCAGAQGRTAAAAPNSFDRTAGFVEPMVPTAPTSKKEDEDLARAINSYRDRTVIDDLRALEAFLATRPRSGWRVAVLANLGFLNLHYGYFSRALQAWEEAWHEGKDVADPSAKALVDRTAGELARLQAGLGHKQELAALLEEIGNRPVSGPATESVQIAREVLEVMRTDPKHLFLCGPRALKALMLAHGATPEQVRFLERYRARTSQGVSLAELAQLADQAQLQYGPILRKQGAPVPVPSIVHWKTGHFAAILKEAEGRFQIKDPVLGHDAGWITQTALDAEVSGYFLAPIDDPHRGSWQTVDAEHAARILGAGPTFGPQQGSAQPPKKTSCGMCSYSIEELVVGLAITDMPVGYTPPKGPSAKVVLAYNQREDSQPANFSFFNISPKWAFNWLSYVQDSPQTPGYDVMRYLPAGGAYYYLGYNSTTGAFTPQNDDASELVFVSKSPITYKLLLRDGSVWTYARSDGSVSYPRRVFLTQITDPAGNSVTLNYDSSLRLISITDAIGRSTTFSYNLSGKPLLITAITDPFGRSATLTYDGMGHLSAITDVLGLTSSFTYDASSLINSMTTPYGTTQFAYGTTANSRFLQITDPLGYSEREEWLQPAPIPITDPSTSVPTGMNTENAYLEYRDSFHWDKHAYVVAGCTPTGGCNYNDAHITHFNHDGRDDDELYASPSVGSIKNPLENRVWYNYQGQTSPIFSGAYGLPTAVGRVLDSGQTQLSKVAYNAFGNPTSIVDPLGRQTSLAYAANQIDLQSVAQTTGSGSSTLAQFTYNSQHRPLTYTDAAGQTTHYTYNTAGQLTSLTNALGQKTAYNYNSTGDLTSIVNANGKTAASFTYDNFDRIATYTDSEGWTVSYGYDAADRLILATYPDGTTDQYTYSNLDLVSQKDRQGNVSAYSHDANRRLTAITDPLGNETQFGYYENGRLKSLTDPNGHTTAWNIDLQSRPTAKIYADGTQTSYGYETTTSRLKSITDALGQSKNYQYALDDRLAGIGYQKALNPTPNVGFTYDPYFPRVTGMTDGTGATSYTYFPVGALGALQLQQETGPLPNGAIAYGYDALGRIAARTVGGGVGESFQYDALGRLIGHTNALGQFGIGYLGETEQPVSRGVSGVRLATAWNYQPNSGDRRLAGIVNATTRQYQYTTTPENLITGINEQATSGNPLQNWTFGYDNDYRLLSGVSSALGTYGDTPDPTGNITKLAQPSGSTSLTYNSVNEVVAAGAQPFVYDANGNLLSDGARTYAWDAENRLVGITYAAQPGKQTTFGYDGLDRRVAINTTAAGITSAADYIWCGSRICQSRSGSSMVNRLYYDEGEAIPASQALFYYGPDQIGSVRDVYATSPVFSIVQSYNYDPYGNPTLAPATGPLTDFRYAGMSYHPDSGLYLTQYRAYDPRTARWLSRDPIGGTRGVNMYDYVGGTPTGRIDPTGLIEITSITGTLGNIIDIIEPINEETGQWLNIINGRYYSPEFFGNQWISPDEVAALKGFAKSLSRIGKISSWYDAAESLSNYLRCPTSENRYKFFIEALEFGGGPIFSFPIEGFKIGGKYLSPAFVPVFTWVATGFNSTETRQILSMSRY